MIFISIQKLLLWIYFLVHCSPFIKLEKEVRVLEGFKSFFLLSKSRVYDWFTFIVSVFAVDRTFLFTGSNFSNNFAIAQFSSVLTSKSGQCMYRKSTYHVGVDCLTNFLRQVKKVKLQGFKRILFDTFNPCKGIVFITECIFCCLTNLSKTRKKGDG